MSAGITRSSLVIADADIVALFVGFAIFLKCKLKVSKHAILVCKTKVCVELMKWRSFFSGEIYDSGDPIVVYFDPGSGDTHLLTEIAASIMHTLATKNYDRAELADSLRTFFPKLSCEELDAEIEQSLRELSDIHLIEPC